VRRFLKLNGDKMASFHSSTRLPDQQLTMILSEVSNWVVNGSQGQVLGFAPCLRLALNKAVDLAISGAVVTSLSRHPFHNVIVETEQIKRLREIIAGREIPRIIVTEYWTNTNL
jgi:hypothetical protein